MKPYQEFHNWDLSPREAVQIQRQLRELVVTDGDLRDVQFVAGADISWDRDSNMGYAGVIVFSFPGFEEVDRVNVMGEAPFPYVPGLLSFREGPLLLEAFARLSVTPDVIMFDGHGLAHPRRMGIATHLGLLLNIPSIGCGKSRLTGVHKIPGARRGNRAMLKDKGECIGTVLRTRDNVNPVFVSIGHRVCLSEAIRFTLRCCDGYRIPKPTRLADHYVGELRREDIG